MVFSAIDFTNEGTHQGRLRVTTNPPCLRSLRPYLCTPNITLVEVSVICRQLGYPGAVGMNMNLGSPSGGEIILFDNIVCTGKYFTYLFGCEVMRYTGRFKYKEFINSVF